jgi:PEGA domain/Family of unknown function (DUF5683)
MNMRALIIVMGSLLFAALAIAEPLPLGGIIVNTNPAGAQVTLTGEVTVSGVSPARFSQLMVGSYEVSVRLFGYENYRTRVTIDPSKEVTVDVRLTPKSRLKSALRSAFIPGWGQRYVDQDRKGLVFTLLAAGTVAIYLKADGDFDDKRQTYDEVLSSYNKATSISEQRRLKELVAVAHSDAYEAEQDRRVAIGTVAVAWGLNILDAIVFFPENRGSFSVKTFSYTPQSDGVTLGLNFMKTF